MSLHPMCPLKRLVTFKTGKLNSNAAKPNGKYPFFTCSQETFRTDTWSFDDEYVLLAGNNAAGIYPLKYFKGRFDAYQRTYTIQSRDENKLRTRFLYYALKPQLELLKSISTGAATKFLTLTLLNQTEIQLPEFHEQQRITVILSGYDDLIENDLRRIKVLEEMAQNLYREWFVKFRFPGHEQVRMVDSALGKIPEGWDATVLGDLAVQVRRGVSPDSVDVNTPYVGLGHIPRKSIALAEWGSVGQVKSTKLRFKDGEILFGKIRPYFHKVAVAPLDGICSSDTIVIRPNSSEVWGLVLGCVSSEEFVAHATQTSQGTKMPRANWGVLVEYSLPLPPQTCAIGSTKRSIKVTA